MFDCLFCECRTYSDKKPKMLQMSGHNMFSESMSWPSISSYLPYAAMNTCQPDWRGGERRSVVFQVSREQTPAGSLTISQSIITELLQHYVWTGAEDQKWPWTNHVSHTRPDDQEGCFCKMVCLLKLKLKLEQTSHTAVQFFSFWASMSPARKYDWSATSVVCSSFVCSANKCMISSWSSTL